MRLDRVININSEFDVYSRFFFDSKRFKGLASRPIGELAGINLKLLLPQELVLPPGNVTQLLQLVAAPPEVSRQIAVVAGATVAMLEIVCHGALGDNAVYYEQLFIPPTRRRLLMPPFS